MAEIWKSVLARLVDLNVVNDPDADSFASDCESSDYEEHYDFILQGTKRIGRLLKGKRSSRDQKSLGEQMPRNDLRLINKMLEQSIYHE